ncbi:BBE domain-containing protein [Streptosporangium subroseum]|uniref:BBE domain-containing protein n=1 Tax=Streptosporangium subroseum TaxID=106412 RepID=UPI00342FFE91
MIFTDSSLPPVLPEDAAALVTAVAGSVLLPGDAGYDDERAVFNLNHDLAPAVIVVAESAADVQATVAFAAGQQLKKSVAVLLDGMEPWQGDRRLVNNLAPEEATDAAAIYGPERYERLTAVKKTYDPANMFRINHNVVPAT